MRRGHAIVACVFTLVASEANAVSLWDRTRDPRAPRAEAFLREAGRLLSLVPEAKSEPETLKNFRLGLVAMAELKGAHASSDPRVLLILGHALLDAEIGREAEVRELARRILELGDPADAFLAAEALTLDALASRGEPARAVLTVGRALPMVWSPSMRSTLLRERGEARMVLGDLRASVRDHRAALLAADDASDKALARFALGLALERAGDLPSALVELRIAYATSPPARGADLSVFEQPSTFFFRPFDLHYIAALTGMAFASSSLDDEAAVLEYERALVNWDRFETVAPAGDAWLANARLLRASCERALQALQKKAPTQSGSRRFR